MCRSLVSRETIVLINPRLNNSGNLQSCCNTSWWISFETTCLYWNPSKLWTASISASGQIRLETSSLSAGYMICKSSLSKVRAAEWRQASGHCVAGKFEIRNGSVAAMDCLCHKYEPTQAVRGHIYICGQWCREAIADWVYGFGACHSAALILGFSLYNVVPPVLLTARQRARRAVWPFLSLEQLMLRNVFCSWFLFSSYEF